MASQATLNTPLLHSIKTKMVGMNYQYTGCVVHWLLFLIPVKEEVLYPSSKSGVTVALFLHEITHVSVLKALSLIADKI